MRREITAAIDRAAVANQTKDIDAFMATFDRTFVLDSNRPDDRGRVIDKTAIKADTLRDWSIITQILEVKTWIERMGEVTDDRAVVYTNQRYHRIMKQRRGYEEDDVVTTQRHEETWVRRPEGWKVARVKELGGDIFVNGAPYHPEKAD